jgi:ketosteroid isomerase-like protein
MSQENVELTRRAYEALSRRDLDAFLAAADPDVVAVPRIVAIEGGALRGRGGIRRWWDSILSAFPDFDAEVISVRGIGDVNDRQPAGDWSWPGQWRSLRGRDLGGVPSA